VISAQFRRLPRNIETAAAGPMIAGLVAAISPPFGPKGGTKLRAAHIEVNTFLRPLPGHGKRVILGRATSGA
jgi:hypothetical protein